MIEKNDVVTYVSSRAGMDPVKTVFVCAPEARVKTAADVRAFAEESGWIQQVEEDGAVLMAPVVPDGWGSVPPDYLRRLYLERRRSFKVLSGGGIQGRGGALWAWETLIYVAGYEEGAVFAADALVAYPGFAAASVLVDGRASSFAAGEEASDHWLVPNAPGYTARNRDVPVAVWLMGSEDDGGTLERYLAEVNGADAQETQVLAGEETRVRFASAAPAARVLVTPGLTGADPRIARTAMEELFCRTIRWKSGPDGELARHVSRRGFYEDGAYIHGQLEHGGNGYPWALYLPRGMSREEAAGLPLVVSLHGRGEPVWIFCQKNGWEDLADETRAFAVLLPDSPGNLWILERDGEALVAMVSAVVSDFALDAERVYLTGFSNGALFTMQVATTWPHLFAAASPWNSPGERARAQAGLGAYVCRPGFAEGGTELPFFLCYGDADEKAPLPDASEIAPLFAANGCTQDASEPSPALVAYPPARGYRESERLSTSVYRNAAGAVRMALTTVRNMPHGAIADEARAAWEFMSRFRRVSGAAPVVEETR